jgi:hypothetical protein
MKDKRGRKFGLGERVRIEEDIPSVNGMLYKHSICKVESMNNNKVQVQDRAGKLWWIESTQVSASFL